MNMQFTEDKKQMANKRILKPSQLDKYKLKEH